MLSLPHSLRAIAVAQPWVWALVHAGKRYYERTKPLNISCGWSVVYVWRYWDPGYIRSSLDAVRSRVAMSADYNNLMPLLHKQLGHLIGLIYIEKWTHKRPYSIWHQNAPLSYAAIVSKAIPLPTPIPYHENYLESFWLPDAVATQVKATLSQ